MTMKPINVKQLPDMRDRCVMCGKPAIYLYTKTNELLYERGKRNNEECLFRR